jgi:hypothetical protein
MLHMPFAIIGSVTQDRTDRTFGMLARLRAPCGLERDTQTVSHLLDQPSEHHTIARLLSS